MVSVTEAYSFFKSIISDVLRKPSNPALVAAIEEIAEDEYLLEAEEKVEVDVPEQISETFDQFPDDSGVDTLEYSKPVENFAGE